MSTSKLEKLTPEQEALIPVYQEKWKAIALSTERIDREKATVAVKAAYAFKGLEEPEIIFVESPYLALNKIADKLVYYVQKHIDNRTLEEVQSKTDFQLSKRLELYIQRKLGYICLVDTYKILFNKSNGTAQNKILVLKQIKLMLWKERILSSQLGELSKNTQNELFDKLYFPLKSELEAYYEKGGVDSRFIDIEIKRLIYESIFLPQIDSIYCYLNDSYPSLLNLNSCWEVVESLVKHCGWISASKTVCYVCDRPTQLSFDNQQRLHAEGKAAIAFSDGFSVYAYHGARLPEKYGKIHPNQWQAKWLLEEANAELRRVLIQGIGYDRMCQELEAKELDNWREYSLLKIDVEVDVEPIYLLKMTCPSTQHIHILRVPPNMKTAKEAIRWVNWDIDPEEFSVET